MKFSTRLIRKGALIDETRLVFQAWDSQFDFRKNIQQSLLNNPIGAKSISWLKEVRTTLSSRFSGKPEGELLGLADLAKSPVGFDVWQACLHWHCAQADQLYFNFVTDWLYGEYVRGVFRIQREDVLPYLTRQISSIKGKRESLSEYGTTRGARDLLRMATDFGLLTANTPKSFKFYHIPEKSFLFILHAMAESESNALRIIESSDWRLFLMESSDVEQEILRLHQFKKLNYEVAGSLAQLELPYRSSADYAREIGP